MSWAGPAEAKVSWTGPTLGGALEARTLGGAREARTLGGAREARTLGGAREVQNFGALGKRRTGRSERRRR